MQTLRRLLAFFLVPLALTGCAVRYTLTMPRIDSGESPAATAVPGQTAVPDTAQGTELHRYNKAQRVYGSVGLLTEPTLLVSVYVNDTKTGRVWGDEAKAESRAKVKLAAEWIAEQAASYGAQTALTVDNGTDPLLCRTYELQSELIGGESSESDAFLDEMDELCDTLDTAGLQKSYGTDRVGFLIFLPLAGTSFTMVHYAADGDDYYHEYSCLYQTDPYSETGAAETPAVYAHEILHQFGAPDLYEGSSDTFVSDEMVRYIEQNCPDEIMYDTYAADGSALQDSIPQRITGITAYRLGLTDTCDELARFPALADSPPGVFVYQDETVAVPDPDAPVSRYDYWPDGVAA